nr:aminotransferase class I/II-fold pyridoxal phosphate-dependent enzyme [uncultured Shinella sp.]
MRIELFELERSQSLWENTVDYNLTESGLHPFTLSELLGNDDIQSLVHLPLGYGHTEGEPGLREAIAALHPGATAENVLVTTGSSEANMLVVMSLLEAGDEAIVITPNFMQLPGLIDALGAKAHLVPLQFSGNRWSIDIEAIRAKITPKTHLISICNPNNPTGSILSDDEMMKITALCSHHGIYLHADEIYRGAELEGTETATLFNATPMSIITGGMAKAMALAGLRIGWLVAPIDVIAKAMERQDYTTIGSNTLGQRIAMLALRPETRSRIIARNRNLLSTNMAVLKTWLDARAHIFSWTAPKAGAMAFLRYNLPMPSAEFCRKLREQQSVFLVAGSWFSMEGYLRIGIGGDKAHFQEALQRLDIFLKNNF